MKNKMKRTVKSLVENLDVLISFIGDEIKELEEELKPTYRIPFGRFKYKLLSEIKTTNLAALASYVNSLKKSPLPLNDQHIVFLRLAQRELKSRGFKFRAVPKSK
jgi:hypothetical protein